MILVSEQTPSTSALMVQIPVQGQRTLALRCSSGRSFTDSLALELRLEGIHCSRGGGRGSSQRPAGQPALVPRKRHCSGHTAGRPAASGFHPGQEQECEPQGTSHLVLHPACLTAAEGALLWVRETGSML